MAATARLKPRAHRSLRSIESLEARYLMADVSAPALLQYFEGSWNTIERRAADIHAAGYGQLYLPPPSRADSGNFSVGYDVYDRFDLGSPGNPTLYGTATGLKRTIDVLQQLGNSVYVDFILNHNGFSDLGTPGFQNAGGYPGFVLTLPTDIDGDFHGAFESGDQNIRLSGLIDIAQEKNYQYIRSPVPGFANNLPAGTAPAFGRLANVPDENNRRFYPDQSLNPIIVFDPSTGESNLHIYPFNETDPMAGDPTSENATGLLMRYAQWLVQVVGADGLRIDAAKHVPQFVLNFIDRAVYRSNPRLRLDGSQQPVFSFSEVFDPSKSFLQSYIRKDINPLDPGRVGGNRDVLDFPLFFAMRNNLTDNGVVNDWRNIVSASQDSQDDGFANNGSQGVSFVSSHDEFGPALGNVAYAYTLMRPGNALVYFNAEEFGTGRDFPKDGRGDALGGQFGNTITKLVDIRNRYGRGNYIERWLEKELLAYERQGSAVVLLSNRLDNGFDSRTIQTSFAPGTQLIELTGNAANPLVDPHNDLPEYVVVNGDGTINIRFPRNQNADGVRHDLGYLMYGLATPQGSLNLTSISQTLPGDTPTGSTNGTARLSSIDVITSDTFDLQLATSAVNLLGIFRDAPADGDNALFKIDAGLNLNGNGGVDFVTPGSPIYGFEAFQTTHAPGYGSPTGDGNYVQTINAAALSEGMHFITARAFRHREPGEGEALFTDFRRSIYVDRLAPESTIDSFAPIQSSVNENRRAIVRSDDMTADNVHVFLDLPAGLTDAQVVAMVGAGSQSNRIDRDLFTRDFNGLTHGNHVLTTVTYEMTGRYKVERVPGWFTSTIFGAGLGDLDFDGDVDAGDADLLGTVAASNGNQFNPAGDFNGDGFVNTTDVIQARIASPVYNRLLGLPDGGYRVFRNDTLSLSAIRPVFDQPNLVFNWDLDADGQFDDATGAAPTLSLAQRQSLGIATNGAHPLALTVSNGAASVIIGSQVFIEGTLRVSQLTPTESGFIADLNTALDTSVLNLYDSSAGTLGVADLTLTGNNSGAMTGSVVISPDGRRVTFIRTGGTLPADTYQVTLRSHNESFKETGGTLLDGNADEVPGDAYSQSFTIASAPSNELSIALPDFARGFAQAVNLPLNSNTGIPITVSTGQNVTRIDVDLVFNPALLNITGFSSPIAGATVIFLQETPGVVHIRVESTTEFATTGGTLELGRFTTTVPSTAMYASKHILDLRNASAVDATSQSRPIRADDALHVVAFPGDANGNQSYSSGDATLTQRLIVGNGNGLVAFQLADPVVILDMNRSGSLTSGDVTLLQRLTVGTSITQAPPLPTGVSSPGAGGPDPRIYIPKNVTANHRDSASVPVMLEVTEPSGITLGGVELAIAYDATRFQATRFRPGTLWPSGVGLQVNATAPGLLRVSLSYGAGLSLSHGQIESLFLFDLTAVPDALPGTSSINLLQQIDGFFTQASDADLRDLTLIPAPLDAADGPEDGTIALLAEPMSIGED